jgi:thiamine biosynthesis protein ThiI
MKYDIILIRYGELSLKSPYVRKYFETTLIRNLKKAFTKEQIPHDIRNERGRIYLSTTELPKAILVLSRIFGIVSFSPAIQTTATLSDISHVAQEIIKNIRSKQKSFAIRATRVGTHSFSSQDVAVQIGTDIVTATHLTVDLKNPDIQLYIEIRGENAYLFTEKIQGAGGLPLGTQGKILVMVENSSSLLAAWYLMRRGCNVIIATKSTSLNDAICSFLTQWYSEAEIIEMKQKLNDIYQEISTIASEKKCDAIATGFSLDEPSQTLSTITHLKKTSTLPILTPLLTMTLKDINQQCKKRGIPA